MTHVITRYGLIPDDPEGVADTAWAGALKHQAAQLDAALDARDRAVNAAATDTALSDVGRRAHVDAATRTATAELDRIAQAKFGGSTLAEHTREHAEDARFAATDARELPGKKPLDPTRAREIRDRLYALAAGERFAYAQRAAEADDRELLAAIHTAPAAFPVLDAKQLDAIDRLHLERHFPERVAASARRCGPPSGSGVARSGRAPRDRVHLL